MDKKFLRGITWDHVRGYGPLEASVKSYKEMKGVNIHWDKRSLKDFGDASLELLAKEYDLIIMDHPHCGTASATRCILPLDEILDHDELLDAANSVGPSFDSYFYSGHQWALPVDAACQVSCRRPDLLSNDALPKSWGDVFNLVEVLKSKGQFIGVALCPTDCNCSFLTLCAQFGGLAYSQGYLRAVLSIILISQYLIPLATPYRNSQSSIDPVSLAGDKRCFVRSEKSDQFSYLSWHSKLFYRMHVNAFLINRLRIGRLFNCFLKHWSIYRSGTNCNASYMRRIVDRNTPGETQQRRL